MEEGGAEKEDAGEEEPGDLESTITIVVRPTEMGQMEAMDWVSHLNSDLRMVMAGFLQEEEEVRVRSILRVTGGREEVGGGGIVLPWQMMR